MAFNPLDIFKFKSRFAIFKDEHPDFRAFIGQVSGTIEEGSIVSITVTAPDGTEISSEMKVTANDMETAELARSFKRGI